MRRILRLVLFLSLGATCVLYGLGFLGRYHWIFDILSHFRWQYLIFLFSGTSFLFLTKRKFGFFFLPFIATLLIEIVPFYFPAPPRNSSTESTRIVCINLLSSNGNFEAVDTYVTEKNPDLIVLQEFTTLWRLMLEPRLVDYEYRLEIPRIDNFGIAV